VHRESVLGAWSSNECPDRRPRRGQVATGGRDGLAGTGGAEEGQSCLRARGPWCLSSCRVGWAGILIGKDSRVFADQGCPAACRTKRHRRESVEARRNSEGGTRRNWKQKQLRSKSRPMIAKEQRVFEGTDWPTMRRGDPETAPILDTRQKPASRVSKTGARSIGSDPSSADGFRGPGRKGHTELASGTRRMKRARRSAAPWSDPELKPF